jgi:rhamnosyl/mannosyltransferase
LNILHVYRTYFPDPPGGVQEAIRQIAFATGSLGMTNTVFTLSPNPRETVIHRPEATVIRRLSWMAPASCDLGGPDAFSGFAKTAKTADIILYHMPWPFADLLHLTVRPKAPAMMTWHSDVVRQRWLRRACEPLTRHTLASVRAVVATSETYAKTSPTLSRPSVRGKVRVIPLGIDEATYPTEGDDAIFEKLGIGKEETYFLFVGVLRYYKGLHFLIDAAQGLGAKVVIAGEGPEGANIKALAADRLSAEIVFAGKVSDKEKISLLKRCRAFILPSHLRSEAFGMVLIEAAMFGKPMISCEIGSGTSFVNAHAETGFVVPPASPHALANAMRALLDDDALAIKMGKAARARYERLFSGPALGKAYAALFSQ